MSHRKQAIAVVEWNWFGHIPSWYKLYCAALLHLGHEVTAFCPKPEEMHASLESSGLVTREDLSRLRLQEIPPLGIPAIRPRRFQGAVENFYFRRALRHLLRVGETVQGRPFDLVFFSCLHEGLFTAARRWKKIGCPAAALVLNAVANDLSPDKRLEPGDLNTFAVLDSAWTEKYQQAFPEARFFTFPDLVSPESPEFHPLGAKLETMSAGKPIVLLPGVLSPHKGTSTFVRLPFHPALQEYFFAMAGYFQPDWYSDSQRAEISRFQTDSPNTFSVFGQIDEDAYESMLGAADLIFAAYHDFKKSSNTLGKAALFQKPIIVSEGEAMARRVRDYRLGEVVPEDDVEATAAAITRILRDPAKWKAEMKPRWNDYLADNSYEKMVDSFRQIIPSDHDPQA